MVFAAAWMALAAAGSATAADFDHGFTSYLTGQYNDAFNIWRDLAEAGDKEAQFGLGLLYEQGRGVLRDIPAAASWYTRAAEQGSMRAQTQIAGMYARGHGVVEDWDQAIAWWLRAEAQGSMRAKFHLGQAYQYGSGVERDLDKAVQWYDESAVLGYRPAALLIEEINRLQEEFYLEDDGIVLQASRGRELVLQPSAFYQAAVEAASRDSAQKDDVRHAY